MSMQCASLDANIGDNLLDFKQRGWIQPAYLDHMLAMQRGPHASYYGDVSPVSVAFGFRVRG
jgi:asparagine synthase (glutamine-hydrolysing)